MGKMKKEINNAHNDQTLVNMMAGVALFASIVIGFRTESWLLGIGTFAVLFASTYLRGIWGQLAAVLFGIGCAWAGAIIGSAFDSGGANVAGAIIGFVIGAGAHIGAQRYVQDVNYSEE